MSRERTPAARRRLRRQRLGAVLAAGIVVGVGSFATIAAWTDTENATGNFAASVFDTESQSAGSPTYTSQTTAPGASMTFSASGMSPSVSFYAWLNVRTTPATTDTGTVALTAIANTGALAPALQYRAVRMTAANPTATCGSAAFSGTPTYIAGGSAAYLPVTQVPASPTSNPIGAAGAQIGFCFEVRVTPGSATTYQGQVATVTWTFTSTSTN